MYQDKIQSIFRVPCRNNFLQSQVLLVLPPILYQNKIQSLITVFLIFCDSLKFFVHVTFFQGNKKRELGGKRLPNSNISINKVSRGTSRTKHRGVWEGQQELSTRRRGGERTRHHRQRTRRHKPHVREMRKREKAGRGGQREGKRRKKNHRRQELREFTYTD